MNTLRENVRTFLDGRDLPGDTAEEFLDALISETDEELLEDLFRSWAAKGISADEIYAIANVMRGRCTRVGTRHSTFVDVVGTGGSRSKTFNVSTAAAFVVAAAELPVAKHGNRAATSNSGSADVLAELGIEPAVDASTAERCLNDIGMCFMFAPNFHRLSPTLAKVRRGLGFPTIFNGVGPLCNPAQAPHQLIGVWEKEMVSKMASALLRLGTVRSWIVHADDGLDEVSLNASTLVAEISDRTVRTFSISAPDFGIEPACTEGLSVQTASQSAAVIREILGGEHKERAAERLVLINAAAALYISGVADSLPAAYVDAEASLRRGDALEKLNRLADAVKR